MSARALEVFLARLCTDASLRSRFLSAPLACALAAGLDAQEAQALAGVDAARLELVARSYAAKRAGRRPGR